jgi:ceramide glucosyltransferase
MLTDILYAVLLFACATNLASAAYVLTAIWRVKGFRLRRRAGGGFRPPVTILKPVCGLDADLYANLRSFCVQDYPEQQIVFGVRDPSDPAIPVIRRLIEEFPLVDISLVIDDTVTGPNLKVSNLGNIYRAAKHAYLVIADSDMRVDPNYVSSVIAPLADSQVGVVTCLYSGTPAGGLPSLLASMFINEWFLPSVLVSAGLCEVRFALGGTVVVRRDLLEQIGGFGALSHYLADDNILGRLASNHGFKVAISGYVVENIVHEQSLWSLFRHELRWARTIRTLEPWGHAFSFLMYGVPLALFGLATADVTVDSPFFEATLLSVAILLRIWMHFTVRRKLGLPNGLRSVWLVPVRDILCFAVWGASFLSRKIDWKGATFMVGPGGAMNVTDGIGA